MLSKLAYRNSCRSIKDYLIYLITVILSFSLVFSFNFIIFSKDILELSSSMRQFQTAVYFVSMIVLFVVGWLIHYTTKFMFVKRSKEFGTYLLLGIEKGKVAKLFLLENIFLGLIALVISFFLGIIFSNVMTFIIMSIFEMPYQVSLTVSIPAVMLTLLYFIFIYLFVLCVSYIRVRRMKIYDLLYLNKQNEKQISKKRRRIYLFVSSVIVGILSFVLCDSALQGEMPGLDLLISIIGFIFSIYGVTISVGDMLLSLVLRHPKLKYRKDHLFIVREFSSKVRTMGMTLGTLSLLTALTFLSINLSLMMKDAFEHQTNSSMPYDIIIDTIYSEVDESMAGKIDERDLFRKYDQYIKDHYDLTGKVDYNLYTMTTTTLANDFDDMGVLGYYKMDTYISLSDYNKLLRMRGDKPITLKENEYYVHGNQDIHKGIKEIVQKYKTLDINGYTLKNKGYTTIDYASGWGVGIPYLIIVPDQVVEGMPILDRIVAYNTKEETTEQFSIDMGKEVGVITLEGEYNGETYNYEVTPFKVKGAFLAENRTAFTMIAFSLLYLAFIFTAVVGTILAIQTLSDGTRHQYHYSLLRKLGVEKQSLYKTIRKQLFIYFALPIFYPILINIITTYSLNHLFGPILSTPTFWIFTVFFSTGLFLLIYLIYFLATYFSFKKNTLER